MYTVNDSVHWIFLLSLVRLLWLNTHTPSIMILRRRSLERYVPIVLIKVLVKASSEKRNKMQVFPTPESPISSNLNSRSYVFLAMATVQGVLGILCKLP